MEFASTDWHAWFTLGVILITIVALLLEFARPELTLIGSLGLLLFAGVLEPNSAFKGFASPAVFTIGALYVVAAGVQRTEALRFLDKYLLPTSVGLMSTLFRLMGVTGFLSAFLNNTPIVAMLVPRIQQWSAKSNIPASQLLIPLSYAAIIGGTTTLIGTSTNIIVSELLIEEGHPGLSMFDLSWVGVPAAIAVLVYFALVGHRLLPQNRKLGEIFEDGLKDCLFELKVADDSELIGKSIEASDLRHLGGAYLAHVQRGNRIIPATPEEILMPGDTLLFTGSASVLDELLEMPGLVRGTAPLDHAQDEHMTLPLFEAVVSKSSDLVGKSLKEVRFREKYQGIVLGIQRQSESVRGGVGRIPLEAGDLLLIESTNGFDKRWNENRNDFYLVAPRAGKKPKPMTKRAPIALVLMALMVCSVYNRSHSARYGGLRCSVRNDCHALCAWRRSACLDQFCCAGGNWCSTRYWRGRTRFGSGSDDCRPDLYDLYRHELDRHHCNSIRGDKPPHRVDDKSGSRHLNGPNRFSCSDSSRH